MKKCITLLFSAVMACGFLLSSCGGVSKQNLVYPDHGYATSESNSWEQLTEDDEVITINWFGADLTSFGSSARPGTMVYNRILEKTKIKINFISAMSNDGSQLSTMVAGNKLTDVVTVESSSRRVQLSEEGYVYPINTLAEKYAPTLLERIDPEISSFFKASDGKLYGLPNHFYTQSDMDAYEEQSEHKILTNGALVARKDWLDAYIAYKKSIDSDWSDVEATTPSGFVEMCKWVKTTYNISNKLPVLLLDHFSMSTGSTAIEWLSEYFAVPRENANGDLLLTYEQDEYGEMLAFLNELYREKIIIDSNLTAGGSTIGSLIMNGYPFAFVGSPQLYPSSFAQFAKENNTEYVPILLTNSKGDTPQLRDLSGNGWLFSMITSGCKYPDRVIKLFDYLMSEEGQSLFYGIEGETYEYEVRPGETRDGITYKYGQVAWKQKVWDDLQNEDYSDYGFLFYNPLVNPMYPRLSSNRGAVLNSYTDYIDYNLKAAISDYSFSNRILEFPRDASREEYRDIENKATSITNSWIEKIPQIIRASSRSEAISIWQATVKQAESFGSADVLKFDNECYQKNKKALNAQYGWPPNDPESGYSLLKVVSIYGNPSYKLEIPSDIRIKK